MINGYPDVPNDTSPEIIIGVNNMRLFKSHFVATYRTKNNDQFREAVKQFSNEDRRLVAIFYQELRDMGFYPVDIDQSGNIVFAIRTRNIVLDDSPMSKEEITAERKRIRESRVSAIGGMPDCKPWDYEPHDSGR